MEGRTSTWTKEDRRASRRRAQVHAMDKKADAEADFFFKCAADVGANKHARAIPHPSEGNPDQICADLAYSHLCVYILYLDALIKNVHVRLSFSGGFWY